MDFADNLLLEKYKDALPKNFTFLVDSFSLSEIATDVSFLNKTSSVFSSNIEGNDLNINSYLNSLIHSEVLKNNSQSSEITALEKAYEFAQKNTFTEKNILICHELLSEPFIIKDKRGKYRTDKMGVFDQNGLVYFAIESDKVKDAMKNLLDTISLRTHSKLDIPGIFYYASFLHLQIAHIHPFWDGNGRIARLIEKWFLAENIGEFAWKIQSEKYYKNNIESYYKNINLGKDYYDLDYTKALPFLLMLPNALIDE